MARRRPRRCSCSTIFCDGRLPERRVVGQRALALDQPARDIAGDRAHDFRHFVAFGQHGAAIAGVLHETVLPLVAAHLDMGDDVDPQPRHVAPADAAVEQFDAGRDVVEQRIERFVQQFEPRQFGVVQIDDDGRTLGRLDARLAHRVLEHVRRLGRLSASAFLRRPHMAPCLAKVRGPRKGKAKK